VIVQIHDGRCVSSDTDTERSPQLGVRYFLGSPLQAESLTDRKGCCVVSGAYAEHITHGGFWRVQPIIPGRLELESVSRTTLAVY
jgi:hypothetical protein